MQLDFKPNTSTMGDESMAMMHPFAKALFAQSHMQAQPTSPMRIGVPDHGCARRSLAALAGPMPANPCPSICPAEVLEHPLPTIRRAVTVPELHDDQSTVESQLLDFDTHRLADVGATCVDTHRLAAVGARCVDTHRPADVGARCVDTHRSADVGARSLIESTDIGCMARSVQQGPSSSSEGHHDAALQLAGKPSKASQMLDDFLIMEKNREGAKKAEVAAGKLKQKKLASNRPRRVSQPTRLPWLRFLTARLSRAKSGGWPSQSSLQTSCRKRQLRRNCDWA